jgi:hypothetical protein
MISNFSLCMKRRKAKITYKFKVKNWRECLPRRLIFARIKRYLKGEKWRRKCPDEDSRHKLNNK